MTPQVRPGQWVYWKETHGKAPASSWAPAPVRQTVGEMIAIITAATSAAAAAGSVTWD